MRSCRHPASEHGISCCHRGPSLYGYGELRSRKQESDFWHLPDKNYHHCALEHLKCLLMCVRVTMTRPNIGRSRTLNQNGQKGHYLRSRSHHPHSFNNYKSCRYNYLGVCSRTPKLILPFLVVRLAFTAGLAAFVPVIPRDTCSPE